MTERLSGEKVLGKLSLFARKAVIFIQTGLNPFGCGYAGSTDSTDGWEVHDHPIDYLQCDKKDLIALKAGENPQPYDSSMMGDIVEWADEGEAVPNLPGGIHKHDGNRGKAGAYEM